MRWKPNAPHRPERPQERDGGTVTYKMFLLAALSLPLGACATMAQRIGIATPPPAEPAPLVVSPACLAPPVTPHPVEAPPMPEPFVRPAGEPNSVNWREWLSYVDRRRERAELAGLFFEGERDQERHANQLNTEQLTQCNAWARSVSE